MEGEVHLERVCLAGNNDLIFSQEAKSHLTAGKGKCQGAQLCSTPCPGHCFQRTLPAVEADRSGYLLPSGFLLFLTVAQEDGFSPPDPDSIAIHQFSNIPAQT